MNSAITNSRKAMDTLGKHHLLTLLAVAATGLVIATGITWRTNTGGEQAVSRPVASTVENRAFHQYHTYYIVDSAAQRDFVENSELQAVNEREGANISSAGISSSILEFRSVADEAI